jgi:hypothetical protein
MKRHPVLTVIHLIAARTDVDDDAVNGVPLSTKYNSRATLHG